jgi:catechol 2,3-dioxygenase-like lactoylglutathione lyase family enzyme
MSVQLNHTIIWCRDKQKSSAFLVELLGLPKPVPFGPMLVVRLENSVSVDFYDHEGEIAQQHYAYLVSDAEFDQIFARVRDKGLTYWADPGKQQPGEVYRHFGGRGIYFDDPDGHLLEVMTRPYEIGGQA